MSTGIEELARTQAALREAGCDWALLSSLANVTYASGFEVPVPLGAGAELAYGPSLALCAAREPGNLLLVAGSSLAKAQEQSWLKQVRVFGTFDSFEPVDMRAAFLSAVRDALDDAGLGNARAKLGVEARTLPQAVGDLLTREFPDLELVEIWGAMEQARLIKTAREIDLLRRAAHVGDVGHNTLAELVRQAGRTEFEMWAELTSRMHRAAGHEIPITGELVTGPRSCVVAYPNGPRERTTERGDAA